MTDHKQSQNVQMNDEPDESVLQAMAEHGQWFVVNTYSGYEDRVATNLRQRIASFDLGNKIFEVVVPTQNTVEFKAGKKRALQKKMFPGYVLVHMILDDDTWVCVRNTPSVVGFVGSHAEEKGEDDRKPKIATKPSPLSEDELRVILKHMGRETPKYKINFKLGDIVDIKDGPFAKMTGKVIEINEDKGSLKVLINMFGRETPVEIAVERVK